jgi:hypothetical protein
MQANRGVGACVAVAVCAGLGFVPAGATAAEAVSQSFTTTGEQQFMVPPGVSSLQVTLVGGNGAAGDGGTPGGIGATVTATLAVSPGETLYTEVAGNGVPLTEVPGGHAGGYNGGGEGGVRQTFGTLIGGGGGGGASDVRRCSASAPPSSCGGQQSLASRLLVAGGGGGGGGHGESPSSTAGGNGGSADQSGSTGAHDGAADYGGSGGLRATSSAGGAAGTPSAECEPKTGSGCPTVGQLGVGGSGGYSFSGGGGGGGGGIFGGGGGGGGEGTINMSFMVTGGGGGGGGGGASGIPAGASGVSGFSLVPAAEAQPSVTFTWTPSAPAAVTDQPSAVAATTAALGGTINPSGWQVLSCAFAVSPAPAGVATFPCGQQLGAGVTPLPVSAIAAGLTPSTTYTVTLMATSVQGTGSGSPVTFVTSTAASGSGPGTGPPAGTGASGGALSVTNLKLSPTRFHRGTRPATIAKQPKKKAKALPTSTTISFVLSSAATAKLSFELAQPGVLVGRKCGAVSKAHRRGKRCTRYTAVHGGVSRAGHAGTDKITFAGVLDGGARLAPSTYRLSLGATGPGGSTTAAQHPVFTLLG